MVLVLDYEEGLQLPGAAKIAVKQSNKTQVKYMRRVIGIKDRPNNPEIIEIKPQQ